MKKHLTSREQKVMLALLRFPELTNPGLARKLGISVSTVSSIKHRLLRGGYLKRKAWVNFQVLGCKYFGVIHIKVNPLATEASRKAAKEKILKILKPVVSSFEVTESLNYAYFRDYKEFHDKMNQLKIGLNGTPYLLGEPKHTLVIMEDTKFFKFDFASLAEKLLLEK